MSAIPHVDRTLTSLEKSELIVSARDKAEEFLSTKWPDESLYLNNITPLELSYLWPCRSSLFEDLMLRIYERVASIYIEPGVYSRIHDWSYPPNQRLKRLYLLGAQEEAAYEGCSYAQYFVAYCYSQGVDRTVNWQKAIWYYTLAAEQSVPQAMNDLGLLLLQGKHIPRDIPKGINLIRKSAALGCLEAIYQVGVLFQKGEFLPQKLSQALQYYQTASDLGYPPAMKALGDCFAHSIGVRGNEKTAKSYYKKALSGGCFQAALELHRLKNKKKPEETGSKCPIM